MRDLLINQQTIFYQDYGVGETVDKYGNPVKDMAILNQCVYV